MGYICFRHKALGCTIEFCKGVIGVSGDLRPWKNMDQRPTFVKANGNRRSQAGAVPLTFHTFGEDTQTELWDTTAKQC